MIDMNRKYFSNIRILIISINDNKALMIIEKSTGQKANKIHSSDTTQRKKKKIKIFFYII